MNKKIFIGIMLSSIFFLTSFSSVANAQTIKPNRFFQQIKNNMNNVTWFPGYFLMIILLYIIFTIDLIIEMLAYASISGPSM